MPEPTSGSAQSGVLLAWHVGYSLTEGWIVLSILLYLLTGIFWLPVVWMQMQLRDMAQDVRLMRQQALKARPRRRRLPPDLGERQNCAVAANVLDRGFMRPWTERVYGIPPGQVVGSSIKTKFEMRDGAPVLFRLPQIDFVDDGPGKPVGIL